MAKDRFHQYLDRCEQEPMSPGDFLQRVGEDQSVPSYRRLVTDLLDTHAAGRLIKQHLSNGGVAYRRRLR